VDTVLNFVENGQNAAEIRRLFDCQDGGRSHHGFLNFWNFNGRNAQGVKLCHYVKLRRNPSNRGQNMAIFRF